MGSEMCIRDSMKLLAMALAGTFVLSGCADNADKQTSSTGTACLLYTSDAADDSLRVDLGGRRIIKKKFFQAEDGIRDRSPSRGLGDVYKRQK